MYFGAIINADHLGTYHGTLSGGPTGSLASYRTVPSKGKRGGSRVIGSIGSGGQRVQGPRVIGSMGPRVIGSRGAWIYGARGLREEGSTGPRSQGPGV